MEELVSARGNLIEASAKQDAVYDRLTLSPECQKKFLLCNKGDIECLFCYYSDTPENVAEAYIFNILGVDSYACIKDGDEYPLYECPECGEETFIYDYSNQFSVCFNCEYSINTSKTDFCKKCNQPFIHREGGPISICTTCFNDKLLDSD